MGNVLRTIGLFVVTFIAVRMLRRWLSRAMRPPTASPYEVLGVEMTATDAEIEEAWRRLVQENHPDRVANMDQAIRDLAAQRTQQINRAYQELQNRR